MQTVPCTNQICAIVREDDRWYPSSSYETSQRVQKRFRSQVRRHLQMYRFSAKTDEKGQITLLCAVSSSFSRPN